MEFITECWESCGEEFTVTAPSRGSNALTDGVPAKCPHCSKDYTFTLDGDGEPNLTSIDQDSLGSVVTDPDATNY